MTQAVKPVMHTTPDQYRLTYLFRQYLEDQASAEELEELFACIRETDKEDVLKEQLIEAFERAKPGQSPDEVRWDEMFSRITGDQAGQPAVKPGKALSWVMAAAATLLIAGSIVTWRYLSQKPSQQSDSAARSAQADVQPGGSKATLTLANGIQIALDSVHNGQLASQGNTQVVKTAAGQLVYHATDKKQQAQSNVAINMLTTPRGGQYQLLLPDGTKVWLNAASSIRFPAAFTGAERAVEITGEAYFEVVHDEKVPFRVKAGNMVIRDLGTQFNVNAYTDETMIKATLLEGSVEVGNTILKPLEQASLDKDGKIMVKKNVNAADVVAWKNGFFSFRDDDLQTVMKQLARWYDVQIVDSSGRSNRQHFSGRIDRSLTLSQVLNGLELANARFSVGADRRVVILP